MEITSGVARHAINGGALSCAAIGLATGFLSGLMGVGGGLVAIPMMVGVLHLSQHRAHGTSLAMMVLTATASAVSYAVQGYMDWLLVVELAVGASIGAVVGAKIMPRIPAQQLRQGLGLVILFVAVKMIIG